MVAVGFALAALIGLSLGTMGGGGSILTVPIFVYVLGFEAKQAIAMSFPVVGGTSLIGALGHWRSGNVDLRTAILFGLVTMGAAYVGAKFLAVYFTGATQLLLLALAMVIASWSMGRKRRTERPSEGEAKPTAGGATAPARLPLLIATGIMVGLLTGLVGIGGGFLIVPALVLFARVPVKQAVGTSLLVIAMNTITGFLGYVGRVSIPWSFVAAFTAVAALGIIAGTAIVQHVSAQQLRRTFSVFLLAMAAFILWENRARFSDAARASAGGVARDSVRGGPPR